MKNIMIFGITSAIAEATAKIFADRNDNLFLIGRNKDRLEFISKDLSIRGASSIEFTTLDVNSFNEHQTIIDSAFEKLKKIDVALICFGTLPDQKSCEKDVNYTIKEINTNAISTISILTHIANKFEKTKQQGTIAVITSVAGDRGRQSNYIYGSAKGMVSLFLQGLRNRLYRSNIHVLDIRPGFVDTPMTANFKKGLLWAKPETIAKCIIHGIDKKKDVVYAPFFWFFIMALIKLIPENIFKKLKL